MHVAVISKSSILDCYGQPSVPAAPPVGQARIYYDSLHNKFGVIDSNGSSLLQGIGSDIDSGTF